MNKLTLRQLKEMESNKIFASGTGFIEHPWFNDATKVSEGGSLEEDGRTTKVKWVAIRGGYHDWAIYHSMDANICLHDYFNDKCHLLASDERISRVGAKLHSEEYIKKLVPCTDKAFAMYRH